MLLTLQSKKKEVPGVISFIFRPEKAIFWRAGQFMQYSLGDDKRYFTISSAPHEQHIMLTTRLDPNKCSDFKKTLYNLKPGQTIEATGPHGSFVLEDPSQNYVFSDEAAKLCFIAGGIGITPFRSILLDLSHQKLPINITLVYANRDQNIVFKDELEKLVKVHYFIGDNHIDENALRPLTSDVRYLVSGPEPFVLILEKILSNLGVLDENIMRDYFPGYDRI